MKTLTFIQRLRTGFGLVCLVAWLGGAVVAGLGVRLALQQMQTARLQGRAALTVERVRGAAAQKGEAVRALLLSATTATNQVERVNRLKAEDAAVSAMQELRTAALKQRELVSALDKVADAARDVTKAEEQLLALAEKPESIEAARGALAGDYAAARRQLERALGELRVQVDLLDVTGPDWHPLAVGVAGAAFLMVLTGAWQSRRTEAALANSLQALWLGVDRLRSGVLHEAIQLPERNEFTVLADSLNRLGAELGELAGQLRTSGGTVLTVNSGLGAALGAGRQNLVEMEALAGQLAASARRVLNTSNDLSRTVHTVSLVADQTAQLTDASRAGLTRMSATMEDIHRAADGINGKLAILNEKAANISQVITTMAKVADQTNLLSLNAAIEAEKAGESGRGFAVVATAIQRLADQTAVAAEDIEQMVREMQAAVTAGVMGMDKFADEVQQGVGDVRKVGGQLDQVLQQVQGITPQVEAVNTTMRAQTEHARQIAEATTRFGHCARATTAAQAQAAEAVTGFETAARRLQEHTAHFKLETDRS